MTYTVQAVSRNQLESLARRKLAQLFDENPWSEPEILARVALGICYENASRLNRRRKLIQIADRLNEALAPRTACRAGCGHCCSMTTMIYEHEAVLLAQVSGRPMRPVQFRSHDVAIDQARGHFGTACPFLVDSRCSVYEVRPLVCRLHHSLNDDAAACNVEVTPDERMLVAHYDVDVIEIPYHALIREQGRPEPWGAIQEFFPVK